MTKAKLHLRSLTTTLLVLFCAGHPVLADDTEVLLGRGSASSNVLFIMDTSGSMGDNIAGTSPTTADPSRLSIVQSVFSDLMNNTDYHGMNVALMRFDSGGKGGFFVTPMQQLNNNTKSSIIAASNNFTAGGNTPLSETLYEAARFYGGLSVDFGDSSSPATNHADVFTGTTYDSPIVSECQANNIVLLTDGVPTADNEANNSIRTDFLNGASCNGNCLNEVAGYLHTQDQNGTITGNQTVDTFTIGFTTNQALLEETALAGGGVVPASGVGNNHYFTTSSTSGLASAFTKILGNVKNGNDSFSPPALAANDFNGISHYNKFYFSLFAPATDTQWDGNIKPYSLDGNSNFVDATGSPAVDAKYMFLPASQSYWANNADGASIADGGANGRLPTAANRNLYTYTGNYNGAGSLILSDNRNALNNVGTSDLTPGMLGLSTSAELTAALGTIRSAIMGDPTSSPLRAIGAPLHSQPVLVTYGGTAASPDLTLFVATNDGFLHALNASPSDEGTVNGGREEFAFIPQELLPILPDLANNTGAHPYGLDGDISVWTKDDNGDHIISGAGEHVYVYVGMRRGGNNYYALDATNRAAPALKWVIKGGPGGTPGFEELGQSWSKPTLATIAIGASTKKVLIFGGGYDTAQDANPLDADDTIGRAIFIVDAETGARLWWAGPTASGADLELATLTNSIPSEIRLFDSDFDGNKDRLYFGDMRGQVFRIDLDATLTNSTGARLASLGGNTEADNRRFYYPPDLVITRPKDRAKARYISLNIGSGYRAHPLNPVTANGAAAPRVNDRFYSLRDPNVLRVAPGAFPNIDNNSLFDVTTKLVDNNGDIALLDASDGWFFTLGAGNGEKVLARSITLNGTIYFTTYTPPALTNTSCAPAGTGRLYKVSLYDAKPHRNPLDITTRGGDTEQDGIPTNPYVVVTENGPDVCVGRKCEKPPELFTIESTYWQDS